MTANFRARNPCKPPKPGVYASEGRNAAEVNLVDAEWTSRNWSSVPDLQAGMAPSVHREFESVPLRLTGSFPTSVLMAPS